MPSLRKLLHLLLLLSCTLTAACDDQPSSQDQPSKDAAVDHGSPDAISDTPVSDAAVSDTPVPDVGAVDQVTAADLDPASGIHVSLDGSDTNDGSASSPLRTIQKAADVAGPGQAVFIHAGTYKELVRITSSGSPGKMITFTGYMSDAVIISGEGKTTWDGIIGIFGADYIRLQNLAVRFNDDGFGILIRHAEDDVNNASSHVEVIDVEVSDVGDTGIQIRGNSHDVTVQGCNTHDLGFSGVDISMWQGGIHPHHVVVRGVTAHDCDFAGIGSEIADDLLIDDNEVFNCKGMGIDIGSGARNIITNNTIDNVDTGIGLSSNVDSEVSYNKITNIAAEALYAYYWSEHGLPHARNRWHHNTVTNALRALYESCQKSDKYSCGDSRDHEYSDNAFVDVGFDWGDPIFYFEKVYNVKFHDNAITKKTPSFETMNISDGDQYGSSVHDNTVN